jgi:IS66 Orf2 like protein
MAGVARRAQGASEGGVHSRGDFQQRRLGCPPSKRHNHRGAERDSVAARVGVGAFAGARGEALILLPRAACVYFATGTTNLRKSFEGLSNEVRTVLADDPLSGHMFVFLNGRRNQVKPLLWSRGGFTIRHKRLECGQLTFPVACSRRHNERGVGRARIADVVRGRGHQRGAHVSGLAAGPCKRKRNSRRTAASTACGTISIERLSLPGNTCRDGGGVSSIGVSWTILNSLFSYNDGSAPSCSGRNLAVPRRWPAS